MATSTHEFSSLSEFKTWKSKIEHERKELYVKHRGDEKTENAIKINYYCQRSGHFISKGQSMRHLKMQGSKKINGCCPASLKVSVSDEKCTVVFTETHVGHENDLGHLYLTAQERQTIAARIAAKIPLNEILNEVRDSVTRSSALERMHLLTKKICTILNNILI